MSNPDPHAPQSSKKIGQAFNYFMDHVKTGVDFANGTAKGLTVGVPFGLFCLAQPELCSALGVGALAGVHTSSQPTLTAVDDQINSCIGATASPEACGETVGAVSGAAYTGGFGSALEREAALGPKARIGQRSLAAEHLSP